MTNIIKLDDNQRDSLEQEIIKAKKIIELPDNWDDEGAEKISEKTFEMAVKFLTNQSEKMELQENLSIPVPRINPVPDGSIDLFWKTDNYELLVNIPVSPNPIASFYGDDYGKITIEGTINLNNVNDCLLSWLEK